MNRSLYLRRWLRALTIFERRLIGPVARNRNAFIAQAALEYEKHGTVPKHVRYTHEVRLQNLLIPHYRAVAEHFGGLVTRQIKSGRARMELKRLTFLSLMQDWIRQRALENAASIAQTDYNDVQSAIDRGVTDGLGVEEIGRTIRDITGLTPFRAATVARTETHQAATFGAIEEGRQAEKEIGIKLVKEWVPTLDDRTRPAHAAMANHPAIPLGEKFDVGGEMMDRPGDPSASPKNLCNCRCGLIIVEAPQ